MPLWSFPGVVTSEPNRHIFTATLDLGLHWRHPVTVHIAGLGPRAKSVVAGKVAQLLPEGTRFQAICERIDLTEPIRAHIRLTDGTDVANTVLGRNSPTPTWVYGGNPATKTWRWPAIVDRVVDGDSVWIKPDLGVRTYPLAELRVAHIDAPEHGTAEGDAATVWAERYLPAGSPVDILSKRLDKYGRILGEATRADGADFGQAALNAGHAVPYEGGPK